MKAGNVLKLNEWVREHKQQIMLAQKSQKQVAEQATVVLGFKVPVGPLGEIMREHGIQRMTQPEREKQVMTEKIAELEDLLGTLAVAAGDVVDDDLRRRLLNANVSEKVRHALKERWSA